MMHHHKYSLNEINDMLPYERDIYTTLLKNWIEEENERIKKEESRLNSMR